MTLTDTGPLVALLNRNDPNHAVCAALTKGLPAGLLVTTWPCLTEAMHLLHRARGYPAQASLWSLRAVGQLVLYDLSESATDRMAELMDKYRNVPMDLADASLVAAAESLGTRCLFTLDSDFYIYRLADGSALQLMP